MARDKLVQFKLTAEEQQRIKDAAERRGVGVAGFVRDAALGFASPPVAAWLRDYGTSPSNVIAQQSRPDYVLLSVTEHANGSRTYLMTTLTSIGSLSALSAAGASFALDPDRSARKQFVVHGSLVPWFVVSSQARSQPGLEIMEITLRPEGSSANDVIRRRIWNASGGPMFFDLKSGQRKYGSVDCWTLGTDSCELKLREGGTMTLPYERVDGLGSAIGMV